MELIKNKQFRPMLAHKVSNEINFNEPVFVQPKLDGIRCFITKDGAFTRNRKEIMNVEHIKTELTSIFAVQPDLILDGELYNHKLKDNFNKIVSLVRKQTPTEADKKESKRLIQFHFYDVALNLKQEHRDSFRRQIFRNNMPENGSVRFVWSRRVESQEDVDKWHKGYLAQGYEGTIVRLNGYYKANKRSKDLLKVKDFQDTEATIIGYVEGKGRLAGGLGKFVMRDDQGVQFGAPAGKFTHEERRDMWKNRKSYLGKIATFEFFNRTPDGSYRHPLFKSIRNYE